MFYENMSVKRIILHDVFQRKDDKLPIPPRYGNQLCVLPAEAMDDFKSRVIEALGNNSKSMEMTINDGTPGSVPEIAAKLIKANDAQFIMQSQAIADQLTAKQISRTLPGGVIVVFSGTIGSPARPFLGIIKAETQSGFLREVKRGALDAAYLKDLFLTPATKLYKIGIFVHVDLAADTKKFPIGWKAFVFDSHMSSAKRDGAAQYFYEGFLCCVIPQDSSFLTKAFFDHTKAFIKALDVPQEKRADLMTGLYTYLKVDNTPTLSVSSFAKNYFEDEVADSFETFMKAKKFPTNAINKDITDLQGQLRLRKMVFSNSIKFTAPPEAFKDMITVETIKGEGPAGAGQEWTRITIRDHIREES
ncbi:nucleoid-associated protein [Bradyrhizobium sp. 62B]|uniref:nucleoid-associated protein n=1 Tax=Bradyrhizobium sp. 62B TaxID=2898442 RepID=UPI002557FE42|nr:nucleoid-associated protein [Bradyrhizobium sp. 62B]